MRGLYLSDFPNNSLSSRSWADVFLEYPLSLLLKLIELFEFSFSLFDYQQLLCIILHFEWVSLINSKIHIPVLVHSKGG